jgi:hypothetical protein
MATNPHRMVIESLLENDQTQPLLSADDATRSWLWLAIVMTQGAPLRAMRKRQIVRATDRLLITHRSLEQCRCDRNLKGLCLHGSILRTLTSIKAIDASVILAMTKTGMLTCCTNAT